ncbi:MAG TPA: hypothetical protein VHB21_28520, partial [Minicystis sp.]|nr:hypothetical protein [Minicystis sp.]
MNALVGPGLVTCRRCGAPLVPDSRWSRGVWACSACGAVRFETPLAQPGSTEIVRQTTADVGGYRAAARPAEVLLVRHWRRPVHALMVALPLLVFGGPIVAAFLGHPELLGLFVQFWYAVFGLA